MNFSYVKSKSAKPNALGIDFDEVFARPEIKDVLLRVAIDTRATAEQRRRDNLVAAEVAAQRVSV